MLKGIDVSNNNGTVNWRKAAEANCAFMLAKATEGTTFRDPTFHRNVTVAKDHKLITGAYGFARPATSKGADEANALLDAIKSAGGVDMPPVLDMEDAGGMSSKGLVAWCREWGQTVQQATGKHPILYASSSFIREHGLSELADLFVLFVADYTAAAEPDIGGWPHPWTFWQHTDSGFIPGHSGVFDLDWFNGTLSELQTFCGEKRGADQVQTGNVKVNGTDFPGAVVDGSWYAKYTALLSLPGATMTRGTNGEVEITVPTQTASVQAPSADSPGPQAASSDGGWTIENRPVFDFTFTVEDVQNPNDAKQTLKAVHAQMLLGTQPWKTPGIPVTVSVNTVHGVLDNQTINTDDNGVATYEFAPDAFPGFVWINMSAQGNLTEGQLVTGKIRVESK